MTFIRSSGKNNNTTCVDGLCCCVLSNQISIIICFSSSVSNSTCTHTLNLGDVQQPLLKQSDPMWKPKMPFLAANKLFNKPKENIPEGSQQMRSDYRSLSSTYHSHDSAEDRGQSQRTGAARWSLGCYLKEKDTHAHTDACTLPDHLYPSLWQQSLPQDRDQFNFKHHSFLVPALFFFLLSLLFAACLSHLAIIRSGAPHFPAKEPGT